MAATIDHGPDSPGPRRPRLNFLKEGPVGPDRGRRPPRPEISNVIRN